MNLCELQTSLFKAYREARKHKRKTRSQLKFEACQESSILKLAGELESRTYELSPSICFVNKVPVCREVIAADFRDRVVHHLLYNWIYPVFDRQFIYDSYSCRVGKGTLFGIQRAKGFIRAESDDFRRKAYVLRLDVSGFFMNVNRRVLWDLLTAGLERAKWKNVPDVDLAKYLMEKFVFDDPLSRANFRGRESDWALLPKNKTLKNSPPDCGLPIGNLTSQLFGNVYMNPLDHYVKRILKFRHYGRYVDDMVFVHSDKSVLLEAIEKVREFLRTRLCLTLHPNKIYLQPVSCGFPFLGAFVLPWRVYPGRRMVKNFKRCRIASAENRLERECRLPSFRGLLAHFDAWKLSVAL